MRCAGAPSPSSLAYITGASSGIGQALALAYARAGWRLCLVARREEAMRDWVLMEGLDPSAVRVMVADVQDVAAITAAGRRCVDELGTPDVVIACAGISIGYDTAELDDMAVMRETLDTNLLGVAATFQPFIAAMRQAGRGRLVGVASVAAIRGLPGHGAYCASKAGVVAYCESLRIEMRSHGVRVVTLLPGFIDTPLTRRNPYPMPFLISPKDFSALALKVIAAGRARTVIPWQMGVAAMILKWLPTELFDRAFAGRGRKPRRVSRPPPV